jgi:hypothetical protein
LEADAADGVGTLDTYLDRTDLVTTKAAPKYVDVPRITETVLVTCSSRTLSRPCGASEMLAAGVERQVNGVRKAHGTPATLEAIVKAGAVGANQPAAYCAGILKNGAAASAPRRGTTPPVRVPGRRGRGRVDPDPHSGP